MLYLAGPGSTLDWHPTPVYNATLAQQYIGEELLLQSEGDFSQSQGYLPWSQEVPVPTYCSNQTTLTETSQFKPYSICLKPYNKL